MSNYTYKDVYTIDVVYKIADKSYEIVSSDHFLIPVGELVNQKRLSMLKSLNFINVNILKTNYDNSKK